MSVEKQRGPQIAFPRFWPAIVSAVRLLAAGKITADKVTEEAGEQLGLSVAEVEQRYASFRNNKRYRAANYVPLESKMAAKGLKIEFQVASVGNPAGRKSIDDSQLAAMNSELDDIFDGLDDATDNA